MNYSSMQLKPGTLLQNGKYRILRTLGQGGFGITYEAEQVLLRQRVALKEYFIKEYCIRDETSNKVYVSTDSNRMLVKQFQRKFIHEAQMIAGMSHTNIVKVTDVFEENGTAYYVMEMHLRGSLKSVVEKEGPLSENRAEAYIRQIANALDYIHAQNTVHLDVKPANILLNERGEAVLIDFGISKHYDDAGAQTSSTPVGLSKGFAPLEQSHDGDVKQFTPPTDIYALGATLYYLLTGQVPPDATIVNEDGLSRPKGLSDRIWHVIEKSMQPRRKDRPQNVGDFLSLLDIVSSGHIHDDEETKTKSQSKTSRIVTKSKTERKSKRWPWVFAISIVVAILAYLVFGTRKPEDSMILLDNDSEQVVMNSEDESILGPVNPSSRSEQQVQPVTRQETSSRQETAAHQEPVTRQETSSRQETAASQEPVTRQETATRQEPATISVPTGTSTGTNSTDMDKPTTARMQSGSVNLDDAIETYNQAAMVLETNKTKALDQFKKALTQFEGCPDKEAAELIDRCKTIIPQVTLSIAKEQINAGHFDMAITTLREAISVANRYGVKEVTTEATSLIPNVWSRKGAALMKAKDFVGAAAAFKVAVSLVPEDGQTQLIYGQALMQAGDNDTAVAALEAAAANGKADQAKKLLSNLFLKEGMALVKANKSAEAIAALEKANGYAENANAYKLIASANTKLGKSKATIEAYKKYLVLEPNAKDAPDVMFTIAATAQKAGDKATAIEYYKKLSGTKYAEQASAQLRALQY